MFEAYKVAVKLTLINNVSSGLSLLAGQFQGLNKHLLSSQEHLSKVEKKLANIKKIGLLGGVAVAAGGVGLLAMKGPLEEAKKFQNEVAKFASLGLGEKINNDAVAFVKGMKTYGVSMTENMTLLRDAQAVFRDHADISHATMVAPLLAKMRFASGMLGEEKAAVTETKFMDMLRVIEMRRGLNSPEEFSKQANMIYQVLATSGGRVSGSQYLNLLKTGGVAAKTLSNASLYYQLEPLIQEMGGFRVGTGLMSAYQNLILGRTTVQSAKELNRLGLLDPNHVEYNKIGMIKRILPGGLKGGDMMQQSPVDFLEHVLLPSFRAKGITSEQDTLREIGLIFSNRTASQLFSTMFLQLAQIRRGEILSSKADTIEQGAERRKKLLSGEEIELRAKFDDALNVLGTTILPLAIRGVQYLTDGVKQAIAFMKEFPRLTKALAVGFTVLAAAAVTGGAISLAVAGFKSLSTVVGILGGSVGPLAAGFASLATTFPVLTGLLGGVAVGSLLKDKIDDWINKNTKSGSLGGWIYDKIHGDELNPVAAKPKAHVQVKTAVHLDGRKIGEALTWHQAKEMNKAFSGTSRHDFNMMAPIVSAPLPR